MALRECIIYEPPRPGAHPSGINGGLGASLLGVCDDGKATISNNDLLNALKAIVAVEPMRNDYRCHHCRVGAQWIERDKFKIDHRKDCPWFAAKNYLADHV